MDHTPFYQEKKFTTALVITSFPLTFVWGWMLMTQNTGYITPSFLIFYAVVGIAAWILVYDDMSRRNFYHKKYWILFMFILSGITPMVYVIQRHKLEQIETAFDS